MGARGAARPAGEKGARSRQSSTDAGPVHKTRGATAAHSVTNATLVVARRRPCDVSAIDSVSAPHEMTNAASRTTGDEAVERARARSLYPRDAPRHSLLLELQAQEIDTLAHRMAGGIQPIPNHAVATARLSTA